MIRRKSRTASCSTRVYKFAFVSPRSEVSPRPAELLVCNYGLILNTDPSSEKITGAGAAIHFRRESSREIQPILCKNPSGPHY